MTNVNLEEMSLWDLFDAVDTIVSKDIYKDDENNEDKDEVDDNLLLCEMNELL